MYACISHVCTFYSGVRVKKKPGVSLFCSAHTGMAQGGARGGLTPSVFIAVFLMSVSVCPRAVLAVECWRYGTLPCTFGNCTFSFVDAATANELKREGTCTSTGDTLYIHNLNFLDTVQPGVFSNMPATMKYVFQSAVHVSFPSCLVTYSRRMCSTDGKLFQM